jgi:hypothetical protein
MKQFLPAIIILFIYFGASAQSWRVGEQQVRITIASQQQADVINEMKLSFDYVGPDQVRAYVVPSEKTILEANNIPFIVEVDDLNKQQVLQAELEAYHSYQEIIDLADSLVDVFPEICEKHIFGESMGGRQLAALKISDNVSVDEAEAEVVFDGGIHGDEICGPENLIRFARDICIDYGTDPQVTDLINTREIWLYLMVNPDGREAVPRTRYNNNGVDLNRDFGYMWDGWGGSTGAFSQVESKALRDCMYQNQFVVHTTYHGGTEYISLPWSYRASQPADWDHIYELGGIYADESLYPSLDYGQGNSGMYAINGSTKDSNYGIMGSISWSMEISYDKQPPASQLMLYYNRNYPAMLAMIEHAGYGLEGTVTDAVTGEPVAAIVLVNDFFPAYTDPTAGDFHKYVLPGTYNITIMANGYESQTISDVEVNENSATATDVELQPAIGHYAYKFASSQIPNNNENDEGNTLAVYGAPDEIHYSIGVNGWVVLDMQYPITDGSGPDLVVHENDATPEGYTCYASMSMDGPWTELGQGEGTTEFDLAEGPIAEAQFIRILDDGDGFWSANDAGFDLDAIEAIYGLSAMFIADLTEICEEGTIGFSDASSGEVTSWDWAFEGGTPATSTLQNPTIAYSTPGIYDVTLTVSDGTDTHTHTFDDYITVDYPAEQPETPLGDTMVCINFVWQSVYTTTGSANAASYDWELTPEEAGTIPGAGEEVTVEWNEDFTGMATIKVRGVNACGNGDFSDEFEVMVDICANVEQFVESPFTIYPNPASRHIGVDFSSKCQGIYELSLYNQLGDVVLPLQEVNVAVNSSVSLDLKGLRPGIYVLVFRNADSVWKEKVILTGQ